MARRRRGREINGILLLDKPLGLSSNQALQRVKHLFNAAKAGHTGSLDPEASGLLPLCFGHATRVSGLLLDADKTYRVIGRLGLRTETGDMEGAVIEERPVPTLTAATLEPYLAQFRGLVAQVPPMYSALKVDGKRLYELARAGEVVERKPRDIHFYRIELLKFDGRDFELLVHSSKGAYIRTLVEDIGAEIGCGAVVTRLRRTGLGPWLFESDGADPAVDASGARMWTLDALKEIVEGGEESAIDRVILPTDSALSGYPTVRLDSESAFHIRHGHPVFVGNAPQTGLFRLYGPDDLFLGMGEVLDDGRVAPRRLFAAL
ncbi:tRNA pseudouridine(55) synthase TruB [Halothiobacillus diazotrophicus]|uniref:tRNA pseudouridine synthase B n=1 Tax=Halothiobacillus diazotrophicus TaxID=1860122 RepID=A0A191ZJH3_9GAMM|nr:tRNA pseudouridine(55) synthase TruB [Halothiobacillus diazotrophicus]ANJ67997.1 tRNA pseudouridine(55) synthase TruB [Halothiobacillus diazotrophicus]